jgi:hypothetical protein
VTGQPDRQDLGEPDTLVVEERFAIVPEWVLDADISDGALRLYAVLLRYGQSSGARMPGRATLARRLRKKSTDTVDRAMKELVSLGAVAVEHRYDGKQRLTNRYHVRTANPGRTDAATPSGSRSSSSGGRSDAARGGRGGAGSPGRTDEAGVAAHMRHDPEHVTQSSSTQTPPPPSANGRDRSGLGPSAREEASSDGSSTLLADCGVDDLEELARRCATLRRQHRLPTGRWSAKCLHAALHLAVRNRGWPAQHAVPALLEVAADPNTRSPMRVAEAGPWWDHASTTAQSNPAEEVDTDDLADAEQRLDALDGRRLALQREARRQLQAERLPLTRATVALRAAQLIDDGWNQTQRQESTRQETA